MRNRRQVEHRIIFHRGVITGVIAKRSLWFCLARLDITFQNKIDIGRHFQVNRLAPHHLDGLAAQKSGEQNFVQPIGQRGSRGKCVDRIAPDCHRHRHALAPFVVTLAMTRPHFVDLPVHPRGAVVIDLHPIYPNIPRTGFGITRMHIRQGNETAAVLRPALQDRNVVQTNGILGGAFPIRHG